MAVGHYRGMSKAAEMPEVPKFKKSIVLKTMAYSRFTRDLF